MLPITIYALHDTPVSGGAPTPVFLGVTFVITAVVGFVYAGTTRLNAPRYATVIAVQPVPPLLAYPLIESPAGWGLACGAGKLIADLILFLVSVVVFAATQALPGNAAQAALGRQATPERLKALNEQLGSIRLTELTASDVQEGAGSPGGTGRRTRDARGVGGSDAA